MSHDRERFDDIFRRRLNTRGLGAIAYAAMVCTQVNQIAAGRFEAVKYSRGVLTLKASSPSAAHELRLSEGQLLQECRSALKFGEHSSLKLRIVLH